MAMAMDMAEATVGAGTPAPSPRRYHLLDRLSGEEYTVDGTTLERITGIEAGYIDWAIAKDGVFESGDWQVGRSPGRRGCRGLRSSPCGASLPPTPASTLSP